MDEIDLTGRRFWKLVAQERVLKTENGWKWRCQCDCGQFVVAHERTLLTGSGGQCWRCSQLSRVGRCAKCKGAVWARGLCHNHYTKWRMQDEKIRQKTLALNREAYGVRCKIEGTQWKVDKNRKARKAMPDWYVRQCHKLPPDTPKGVIDQHRRLIMTQRDEREKQGRRIGQLRRKPDVLY